MADRVTEPARRATETARDQTGRAVETAKDQTGRVQEKSREVASKAQSHPTVRKALKVTAALAVLTAVLVGGAAVLTGGGFLLLVSSPLLLMLSPVLVPMAVMAALGTGAFVATSTAAVTVLSFASWLYRYLKGKHPVGADKLDMAKRRLADKAYYWTQQAQRKSTEVADRLQDKLHDAAKAT